MPNIVTPTNSQPSGGLKRLGRRLLMMVLLPIATIAGLAFTQPAAASSSDGVELLGHGGQCLDIPYQNAVNGQDLWMWDCNDTIAQNWTISDGRIQAMGKCLDIEGPSREAGALAQIWDCQDVPQHQWRLTGNGEIVSKYSGLCLDVAYSNTQRRAPVHLWVCNGTSAQNWNLQAQTTDPHDDRPEPPASVPCPDKPVTDETYIESVRGIEVHRCISDETGALVDDAADDGIILSGSGWRSHMRQHELRKINGCPDGWTHYEGENLSDWSPSSSCRVETARPGASHHEKALAIDFRCAGGPINSHSNSCFKWLAANAGHYGFFNLPSEPWHWSTTGH